MSETSQNKMSQGGTSERPKAKKRDRSASEDRLLKAAEDVFSKHGFKGATTRMIAQKAKVNESLIGRYFEGKMGLLLAIIKNHVDEIPEIALPYPPQETLLAELLEYSKAKLNIHCRKNEEFFKIVLSQALTDAKFLKRVRATIPMLVEPQLKERLEMLLKAGKMRKDSNVDEIVMTLDCYFHGAMLFQRLMMGVPDDQVLKSLIVVCNAYARAYSV